MIRAELERGRRVSVASWVNPDESHADAGFDVYVAGIVEVVETVTEITQTDAAHLLGSVRWRPAGPAGGGLPCRHRAATRDSHADDRNRSYRLRPGPATMAFLDRRTAGKAIERARTRGYFAATESARAFALIRPHEGIWANVVNNYLLGRTPAMGLLYWAVDQTNVTASFGRDAIETALGNTLARPGRVSIPGCAGRQSADHRRHLRSGRSDRPHLLVARLLPDARHARGDAGLRAGPGRPHDRGVQAAGLGPQQLPHRQGDRHRPGRVAREFHGRR